MRRRRVLVALVVMAAGIGGARESSASADVSGTITVSAAASLRASFTQIGRAFQKKYPQARVRFNFGSSSALVGQLEAGAPADVVALADRATMDRLVAKKLLASTPQIFARNSMAVAVKPGNPMKVSAVADLSRVGVVAMCIRIAPCGMYAQSVLTHAGVTIPESSVTRGVDASSTLSQVVSGDAQAAIVYATDVREAGKIVVLVTIPQSVNVVADYPIAVVKGSHRSAAAKAFVDFVLSSSGRSVLAGKGFMRP